MSPGSAKTPKRPLLEEITVKLLVTHRDQIPKMRNTYQGFRKHH